MTYYSPPDCHRTIPLREFESAYRSRVRVYEKGGIPFIAYLHTQGWAVVRTDRVKYRSYAPDNVHYVTCSTRFKSLSELRNEIEKLDKAGRLVESIESDGTYFAEIRYKYAEEAIE